MLGFLASAACLVQREVEAEGVSVLRRADNAEGDQLLLKTEGEQPPKGAGSLVLSRTGDNQQDEARLRETGHQRVLQADGQVAEKHVLFNEDPAPGPEEDDWTNLLGADWDLGEEEFEHTQGFPKEKPTVPREDVPREFQNLYNEPTQELATLFDDAYDYKLQHDPPEEVKYLTHDEVVDLNAMLFPGRQSTRMTQTDRDSVAHSHESCEWCDAPQQKFFGHEQFQTMEAKSYAIVRAIAQQHPFEDGNKRTASLAVVLFLDKNGFKLKTTLPREDVLVFEKILKYYGRSTERYFRSTMEPLAEEVLQELVGTFVDEGVQDSADSIDDHKLAFMDVLARMTVPKTGDEPPLTFGPKQAVNPREA